LATGEIALKVVATKAETDVVRSLVLESADGAALAPFEPGAHVRVALPGGGSRPYSLVDHPGWRDGRHYVLGVRLESPSAGGSAYMHGLKPGDAVSVGAPVNQFPMAPGGAPVLLLAGGVGITPIFSMAARLAAEGRDFALHYFGRTEGALAFVSELREICGDALHFHYDDDPATRPDFADLIAAAPSADVYVCGPAGMIDAVKAAGGDRVRFELFAADPSAQTDAAFEVQVGRDGEIFAVAPDQSIIEALEDAGVDLIYDCQRGDCGICQTEVLEGIPDHRDVVLSDEEKASNKVMQICVSRAKTPRLVLDL
jgi:vanillate O-demethylase ferredoxin subunit